MKHSDAHLHSTRFPGNGEHSAGSQPVEVGDGRRPVKPRRHRRKRWGFPWWAWLIIAVVGLGGVLYGADYVMTEGKVPRGVTVGGVDIGGMDQTAAEKRLRNDLGNTTRETVIVNAGNMSTKLEPTQSGLNVDWAKTVKQAGQQPKNPITRVRSFFEKREVGIISDISDENLNRTLDRMSRELTRQPKNAAISVNPAGLADISQDVPGQTVNAESLRAGIKQDWLNTNHVVNVDATVVDANIRTAAAQKAADDFVKPAGSSNLVFHGRNHVDATITPLNLSQILSFEEAGNGFKPKWNTDAAKTILQKQLASTEVPFRNASFKFSGDNFDVTPSQDGVIIKWDETFGDFAALALDTKKRDHEVKYEDRKATYTTEQAKKASFKDVVGEFTTGDFSGPSGVNIRRVAEMVNGAVVLPGETFSLNGYTGPRGTAQGFVESGIIIDGHSGKAVGGGISQFATTLYNASYFAGMEDVAHTPHSYYISRYPAGREATVYEGAIDLKFKNPFDTPVRITASAISNSVTVQLHGVKQVQVESIPGPRTNPTNPKPIKLDKECTPSAGAPGFTTTDTRVVKDLSGKEISRRTTTTVYDPQPIVTCG